MSSFKKIINFAKPYKKYAFLNIFFNILYAIFNVLSVLAFIPVLGILFGKEEIVTTAPKYKGITLIYDYIQGNLNFKISQMIQNGGVEKALLFVSLTTLFLFFFKNLFRYLASYSLVFLQTNTIKDLQSSMFSKYISLPISFFSEKRKGDAIARITSDIHTIQFTYLSSFETLVREPLTIIFTLISMFAISVKLTLFVFLLLPISGFIISSISKKLRASSADFQKENGYFLSIVDEALGGLKIIKSFTAEKATNYKVGKSINKLFGLMKNLKHRQMIASPLSEFLGTLTIVAILWFGGKLVLSNNSSLQPQEFFGYIGLFYLILNPAKGISTALYGIQQGSASADRIFEILETKNPIEMGISRGYPYR